MRKSSSRVRKLSVSALLAALSVAGIYMASVMPTGQVGFAAVASLFTAAAVIECGIPYALGVFAVSSLLGFLIIPVKYVLLLYVLFFGYYPVVKSFAERLKTPAAGWVVKVVNAAAAACVLILVFGELLLSETVLEYPRAAVILAAVVVFVVYDIGLTKLISFYMSRIRQKRNNGFGR